MSVLLVDDDSQFAQIIKEHLEGFGFNAVLAENGQEALEKFKRAKFIGVLSDIQMPEMNGIEFLEQARRENQSVPAEFTHNCRPFVQ